MFSVVMPLWNKRHTIEATIASALRQTFRDFELIIVDDGSSDGSREALERFTDPRINIITQAQAGPGAARNTGLASSRGAWIAFLDADDIWLPDHLAELDRIRVAHPDAGLIGTAFVASSGSVDPQFPPAGPRRIEAINFLDRKAAGQALFCTSSAAIPRSTFAGLGGFGPALRGQDSEYWARIALERTMWMSNRATAVYRLDTGGITNSTARRVVGRIASLRELGPAAALLVDRYAAIPCPDMRRSVDRYLDAEYRWFIRDAARLGGVGALRELRRLSLRRPRLAERSILHLASLPSPLARTVYAFGRKLIHWFRALRVGGRASSRRDVPPKSRDDVLEQSPRQEGLRRAQHRA